MESKETKNKFKKTNNSLISNIKFILLILVLIIGYIFINLMFRVIEVPQYDLTRNKIYTLSDTSKNVIKDIKTKINIVAYGFDDDSNFINFLKQYVDANPEYLTYEVLTEESNNNKVQKYELSSGYIRVILETENTYKSIDAKTEFITYDYSMGAAYDRTEQVITNGILDLDSNKGAKKVYFLTGHGEYEKDVISTLLKELPYENFNVEFINLLNTNIEVENNDLLVILSPVIDLNDDEYIKLQSLINRGLNIFYTQDYIKETLPNFEKILSMYGVSVKNGYVVETDTTYTISDKSIYFMPQMSKENPITSEFANDGYYMLLGQAGKLVIENDEKLKELNVTKEDLLFTTDKAKFTYNIDNLEEATKNIETGKISIGSIFTKKIDRTYENIIENNEKEVYSKLLIISTGMFAADLPINELSETPLSMIGKNKDFIINSFSFLTDKTAYLKIRKGIDSATFETSVDQKVTVITICIVVPLIIICIGIIVSKVRNRRK